MNAVVIVALWLVVSIPIAVLVAAVIRAASTMDLSEQVERYLASLSSDRRRLPPGRTVRIGAVSALLALAAIGSYDTVARVPVRIITSGIEHRKLFGPPPTPDMELDTSDADAGDDPVPNRSPCGSRYLDGPDVAGCGTRNAQPADDARPARRGPR